MERRPNPQRGWRCPVDHSEPALHRGGARHRIVGVGEHDEPAVTLATRPYRNTAVGGNRILDHLVVLPQRLQHRFGRFLEHASASLHVGEQEGDDAFGKISHETKHTFRPTRSPVRLPPRTIAQIADDEPWEMPATVDDPAIFAEITSALATIGFPR